MLNIVDTLSWLNAKEKDQYWAFFPKPSKGETTESSTELMKKAPPSDQSDPQSPAAAAESDRDKPKSSEKESSQINHGFQESKTVLSPDVFNCPQHFEG